MPRKPRQHPEVIGEPFHADPADHVARSLLHPRLRLQALKAIDAVKEGLERGLVKIYLESNRAVGPWTAHKSLRVLLLFLTLLPLTQYLDTYRLVDPTATGWQQEPLFNMLLAASFYLGVLGLKDLYSKLQG